MKTQTRLYICIINVVLCIFLDYVAKHSNLGKEEADDLVARRARSQCWNNSTKNQNYIQSHIVNKHVKNGDVDNTPNYCCLYCSKGFGTREKLRVHFQKYYFSENKECSTETRCPDFACLYCSSVFKNIDELKVHFLRTYINL